VSVGDGLVPFEMSVVLRRRKVLFGLCEPIAKKQDDGRRAHALCLDTTLTRGTDSFSSKFLSQIAPKIAYNNPQLPFVVQRIPDPRVKSLDPNSPHKGAEWFEGMPTASMTIAFREYIQKREEEGRGWTNGTFCVCGSCLDLSSMRETLLTLCLLFPSQPSWADWYFSCISLSNVYRCLSNMVSAVYASPLAAASPPRPRPPTDDRAEHTIPLRAMSYTKIWDALNAVAGEGAPGIEAPSA
jgi:hypothetical protein